MKLYFTIFTLLLVNFTFAQSNIEVPTFETVQVDSNPYDYITIVVDTNGAIALEGEKIELNALRGKVFELLYDGIKNNSGLNPLFFTELVADKDMPYTKLAPVLNELRSMAAYLVNFSCKSETHQRIPRRKTTGFSYKLQRDKNAKSVLEAVFDKVEAEKKKTEPTNTDEISMLPPPPPPPSLQEYSREFLEKNSKTMVSKIIVINHESFTIDNQEMSESQLVEKFLLWNSKKKVAYILEPSKNATYKDVITPIAQLLTVLKTLRNEESIRLYDKKYDKLRYNNRNKVRDKFPFIIVFDE
ncbi:MAG: ExbD/TolR family protein [Kordia sp.]|uniref:ExbD/TolR family protein n=1 Tax=Kordia sp. TaxID=1965332 RepID=UPI00385BF5C4